MPYPTIGEYKDAIRLAEHSFGSLTHLRPEYDDTGDLHFSSGNFAVVFKMRDTRTNRPVAVKCFLREQPLRNQRYAQISQCLDILPYNPYLLSYTYHPAEIWVETALSEQREFEVVMLDWVEGQTLSNYLQQCCKAGDTAALRKVAEAFDRLAIWLLEQPFAHGDLKPDNILVTPRGGLVLVDYDGMFTPDMAGKEATELGSPAFRHPYRSSAHFGKYIDHVPILVLSLSLHVLAEHPDWLETYYQGDNLILTANDLSKPDSPIFHTIRTQCSAWTTQNRLLGLVNALILPISATLPVPYLRAIPDYTDIQLIPYVKYFKDGRKMWGFCDEHKNLIVDFQYDDIGSLKSGVIRVKKNGKWGFIDKSGKEIVSFIYEDTSHFSEGLAAVRNEDRRWGFIDKEGREIIGCIYEDISSFNEGLSAVRNKDRKWGFIDKKGREIISCIYDDYRPFSEGLAPVKKDRQWIYIDKTGCEAISLSSFKTLFDIPGSFKNGFAKLTRKDTGWSSSRYTGTTGTSFYIDRKGQEIPRKDVRVESRRESEDFWSEGLKRSWRDFKWGFIDENNYCVIPWIYNQVCKFSEGLAAVEQIIEDVPETEYNYSYRRTIWGFIDKSGVETIPFIYDSVYSFKEGLSFVKRNRKEFYIDKKGVEYLEEE